MAAKDDSSKPKSVWVTEFNTSSVQQFYDEFVDIEMNPLVEIVPVFINSYGGQIYSLIAKRDIIKSSQKPVATICMGKAMSCGASLLAAGTKGLRFATPDSRILIHQVSSISMGKASDIKEDAAQVHALNEMMLRNLAEDTGTSIAKLKNEIRNRDNADWVLSAQEAKKLGIIDHIGVPRHVYPQIQTSLSVALMQQTIRKKRGAKKR
jgi:ATP-dependent Clp endopeptidase proteolytic subunit ClpP